MRTLFAACALALLAGPGTRADDKKDPPKADAPTGAWTREANGLDLKLDFAGKDTLKVSVFGGENGAIVTCKYTIEKDGTIKAKVTGVEEKGNFPAKPPKDFEFSFKWKTKGDTGTLSDLKGENLDDVKDVVEGEYARAKKGKKD